MLTLKAYLESKRVSELQEFHTFWADGNGQPPGRREELLTDLGGMLRDQGRVGARLKLLAEKPLLVLHLLVRAEDFAADLPGLVKAADGASIEGYEVEAAARALGRRGFLEVLRDRHWTRYGREVYAVPRELAEAVSVLLMEDRRGPRQVFTLAGHLSALPPARVRRLLKSRGFEESLATWGTAPGGPSWATPPGRTSAASSSRPSGSAAGSSRAPATSGTSERRCAGSASAGSATWRRTASAR